MERLFADGGTVALVLQIGGRRRVFGNPSLVAITWAWVRVSDEREVARQAGYVLTPVAHTPEGAEIPARSDLAEYYALAQGLKALARAGGRWSGALCSDSALSLRRALGGTTKSDLIPPAWQTEVRLARGRLGQLWPVTVGSHPTPEELRDGVKHHPEEAGPMRLVSPWNVLADDLCRQQHRLALEAWHEQYRTTAEPHLVSAVLDAIERADAPLRGGNIGYADIPPSVARSGRERDNLRTYRPRPPGVRRDPGDPRQRPTWDPADRRTSHTFSWLSDPGAGDAATGESGD
jgi:hypothetical protein